MEYALRRGGGLARPLLMLVVAMKRPIRLPMAIDPHHPQVEHGLGTDGCRAHF
jgi:hypothetical protein